MTENEIRKFMESAKDNIADADKTNKNRSDNSYIGSNLADISSSLKAISKLLLILVEERQKSTDRSITPI